MFDTLEDVSLEGKKVIVRSDLNAPIEDGEIKDCLRFEVYSKTLEELQKRNAKVILLAHQGRPHRDDFTRLKKHSEILGKYLDNVTYHDEIISDRTEQRIDNLENGDILLLENVRFLSEELKNKSAEEHSKTIFVNELSEKGDIYVNDAFSAAHRPHASMMGFTETLDSYPGNVMKSEYQNIKNMRQDIQHPMTLVLGGAKPKDEIDILKVLGSEADNILLGGVIGEMSLMAKGYDVNKNEWLESQGYMKFMDQLEEVLRKHHDKIELPIDLACFDGGKRKEYKVENCKSTPYDIGSKTIRKYSDVIDNSKEILMKGPMGLFEKDDFDIGSRKILKQIAETDAYTVIGGGHTSSLVRKFDLNIDDFSHVSIAGGAFIRTLSGQKLPAIEALKK